MSSGALFEFWTFLGDKGMRNLFSPFNRFLVVDALFEGGRMFVGATSVAYLLHSGLGLDDIAFLKTVQALVLILGEVPTGVLADSIGRKRSLVLAVLFGIAGFFLFFVGKA
jgi:MFS family permease